MDSGVTRMDSRFPHPAPARSLAERLERGAVHVLDTPTPFALPDTDERAFLLEQRLGRAKEILFEPETDRFEGFAVQTPAASDRLRRILADCQDRATAWIRHALPEYQSGIRPFRTCFHVLEEATRCLRVTARNDLLHIDALHQSRGHRLLRLFVNLHPTDPRVWASSETLAKILPIHGPQSGLLEPNPGIFLVRLGNQMIRRFKGEPEAMDAYDTFMTGFSRYLKHSDAFQDRSPRKIWKFLPEQAWLAFTDTLVHADLRGHWVLDHLFFVPASCCLRPELSPAALIESLKSPRRRAA